MRWMVLGTRQEKRGKIEKESEELRTKLYDNYVQNVSRGIDVTKKMLRMSLLELNKLF